VAPIGFLHRAFIFAAVTSVPLPGWAQDTTTTAASCTYASCALRMSGTSILAGTDGRKVGSFGFLSAPRLGPWIGVSDSASYHFQVVEDNFVSGQVMSLSGLVLSTLGIVATSGWEGSDRGWIGIGVTAVGLGLEIWGGRKTRRAYDAMQSAIWWYNGSLSGDPIPSDAGGGRGPIVPFGATPEHRGRAGVVLGSALGLAAGLAISSRHPASETAQGLGETLVVGALGGLVGWRIGVHLPR